MRCVFCNSNRFKDPKNHIFISDLTREQDLCFIAISETGRKGFSDSVLRNLCAGRNFLCHCKELRGRSGGILLGIDLDTFDIGAIGEGDFYVKFHLCNKDISFKWALVAIYDPAQANLKEWFLTEMVHLCSHEQLPILVGADFNMLRNPSDKNKDSYERWPFLFNNVIDSLNLRELEMSGRRFTWDNSLSNPTYEKLDRVLVSTEWEKFPLTTVTTLSRNISDHTHFICS
jgi:hypothetical protein